MRTQSTINRVLLASIGMVLLGGGLLVLAGGFDIYRHWDLNPPVGWPLTAPDDVLLSTADRTAWTDQDWWWPAVIAGLAIVLLLALWWFLAQLRRHRPGRMPVGSPDRRQGVQLRDDALSDALAADAGSLPGVRNAAVRLTGRPSRAEAHIGLVLDPDGAPDAVLEALWSGPVERARRSAGWQHLPVSASLQVARRAPHRAD
ncbi:alkaline shock response membrane anchor protein AmaP [Streptomyces sp. NPDC047108]|uniref:alkaline shock response membrane anchor protein AmaP n=1 Tax=Streptomyces sp. NPDC047108 TaxID=3155025 RepID=UPI0033C35881